MVVHAHYPLGEPRGEREARAAVEAGWDVHVICLQAEGEPSVETIDGIHITRLPIAHVRGVGRLRLVAEYAGFALLAAVSVVKVHRRLPINVTYIHAPPDFLIIAALIPRLMGSGVVLDIHDLSPHLYEARFGRGVFAHIAERALRLVELGACAVADRVVTVHAQYRDELILHGVRRGKIGLVMNAPDPAVLEQVRSAVHQPAPSQPFTVAYHGTITDWYGVDLIIEALARLDGRVRGLRGMILGEGDALASAESLARELGLEERIEFSRRYLPHVEALRRVASASCGVIPNRPSPLNRFALSSKLLEYVELGIPVVVARLETLAAHFGPDEVTFFEPGNAESLSDAIAWIAENSQEAREKAERARKRAEAYAWPESRVHLLEALSAAIRADEPAGCKSTMRD
jgi:glycosyltransferase involved in cell wall biosynthesis